MPRPSLAHIAIVALFALVVIPRASIPLIDGDVFWHLRAGREILANGDVPSVDTWSLVGAGRPWTSQDWLSNAVLHMLHGAGDVGGLGATVASLVYAALVAAAFALLWLAMGIRGLSGWLGRVVWLTVGLTVAGPTIGVRVQVVDLTMAAATLLILWGYIAKPGRSWLIGLPLLSLLWANLHAGWVLLFLLAGAVIVGELLDSRLGHRPDGHTLSRRQTLELGISALVAAAAIALNPNGLDLYRYPIETALIPAHRDFLAEWSPPDVGTIVGQLFVAFVLLGVTPALLLGWRRLRLADLLILVGLTVMAASAARFLLVAPIAAAVVCLALGKVAGSTHIGRVTAPLLNRMARPPRGHGQAILNAALIALVVAAGAAVTLTRIHPQAQRAAISEHMPVAAVEWLLEHDPGARPFNTYSWGGYLGFMRPSLPIYIDGRSDVYGDAPIREYAQAVTLETDPAILLDRWRIDHVLFNTVSPLASWLDGRPEWRSVYRDDLASVWVRTP